MKTLNAEKAKSRLLSTTTIIVALNLTMSGTRNMLSRAMHKIGSKRARNWALVTILWASSCQPGLYAQRPAKLSPKFLAVLNAPTLELKDDDAPLLRLKKERFNAALSEAKARLDLYSQGLTPIPDLIEIGERLFRAEADLYDKPEEKVEVLRRQLDVYTEAEASLEKKVKDGLATQADLERLRYDKVSVEMELFNAKSAHDHQESDVQPTPK